MNTKLMIAGLAGVSLLLVASGCSSITRGTPVAGTVIQANMNSGDCQVLGSTEGKATVDSYVLGLVQVIDGDKVQVLGLKFYEEPPVLRFFGGKLEPTTPWPEKLVAKFRADFGDSL